MNTEFSTWLSKENDFTTVDDLNHARVGRNEHEVNDYFQDALNEIVFDTIETGKMKMEVKTSAGESIPCRSGKTFNFKYPFLLKKMFSRKTKGAKMDSKGITKPDEKAMESSNHEDLRSISIIPIATTHELQDSNHNQLVTPLISPRDRIPSTIVFDDSCFEFLDECDLNLSMKGNDSGLVDDDLRKRVTTFIDALSENYKPKTDKPSLQEKIEKRMKKDKSKRKKKRSNHGKDGRKSRRESGSHGQSNRAEEIGYDNRRKSDAENKVTLRDHLQKSKTKKAILRETLSRSSDTNTELSSGQSNGGSKGKYDVESPENTKGEILDCFRDTHKSSSKLCVNHESKYRNKKAKSHSHLLQGVSHELPNKTSSVSLRDFIEHDIKREKSLNPGKYTTLTPCTYTVTDTIATVRTSASSFFSSEFVVKPMEGDDKSETSREARLRRRQKRLRKKESVIVEWKATEFSKQWENFNKKAAEDRWVAITPTPKPLHSTTDKVGNRSHTTTNATPAVTTSSDKKKAITRTTTTLRLRRRRSSIISIRAVVQGRSDSYVSVTTNTKNGKKADSSLNPASEPIDRKVIASDEKNETTFEDSGLMDDHLPNLEDTDLHELPPLSKETSSSLASQSLER
jgi:hypothetical protein